jgi:predicted nucleic acid-binding protein
MRVFLDTAPLIYLFEQREGFVDEVARTLRAFARHEAEFVTSVLTLYELYSHPPSQGDKTGLAELLSQLRELVGADLVVIDEGVCARAARIRTAYRVKSIDALQFGAALQHECEVFYTNDLDLRRVTEIEVRTVT